MSINVDVSSLTQLDQFAAVLSRTLREGDIVYLHGDLGAGKTACVGAYFAALNFTGRVKSPTYTLVESYTHAGNAYHHFDFYRMRSPSEFFDSGLEDYFDGRAIIFVEWPEKAAEALPPSTLSCYFSFMPCEQKRTIRCVADSQRGNEIMTQLAESYGASACKD